MPDRSMPADPNGATTDSGLCGPTFGAPSGRPTDPSPTSMMGARKRAHVLLIGLRGAGKSTVGQSLARRFEMPFHDLDELVLRRLEARSVRSVFEREGEAVWRAAELDALAAFLAAPVAPSVLALGGGAPMVPGIASLVEQARSEGRVVVIHLRVDPSTAAQRLSRDPGDRTSITGAGLIEELAALHEARDGRYRSLSDLSVDAGDGDPEAVAERLRLSLYAARSCSSQPSPR